jgi:hypothetical protein
MPESTGVRGSGRADGCVRAEDVSTWLRRTMGEHTALLDRMRGALQRNLPPDQGALPDRDWCRVYGLYQAGYNALLAEERERAKLQLMARVRNAGAEPMTDEELAEAARQIAIDELKQLPAADLASELARRGIVVPVTDEK